MPPSSQTIVTLLRGINVAGKNKIKMDRLVDLYDLLGFGDIRTYLQSGNILCSTSKISNAALQRKIEKGLESELDLDVTVLCRTSREMGLVVKNNPYLKKKNVDASKLHVIFLQESPSDKAVAKLSKEKFGKEEFAVDGSTIYLHCPEGYGKAKLTNNFIESRLGVPATTRNWKTVNKLHDMSNGA
jgi:uncharacterized protein (DUF1697 family)